MQKVVGSNPISRFTGTPLVMRGFVIRGCEPGMRHGPEIAASAH